MTRFLPVYLILLALPVFSYAQREEKIEVKSLNRQFIQRKDTVYRFYAINPDPPVKARPDRTYYWYKSDTILTTAGSYDGRLLDGSFTAFYPDKNLKEEGLFKKGLRTGKWQTWYPGGRLRSLHNWKEGKKNGPFTEYDPEGKRSREGHYRHDLLSGSVLEYTPDGKYKTVTYKDGIPVPPQPPKPPKPEKKEQKKSEDGHAS